MSQPEIARDRTICTRKERRYKVSEEGAVRCETTLATCGIRRGTVIDLSANGVRLLCEGQFEPGQAIFTELTTFRSHGIYQGEIRRVEPWVNGQSVLGCSLSDPIPEDVLQDLANEGAVNRRSDERFDLPNSHSAKLSWPLNPKELDVELHDFSRGGMKIDAPESIPEDSRLRFRIEVAEDQELIVEAKAAWTYPTNDGRCLAGVAFMQRDASTKVADTLGLSDQEEKTDEPSVDSGRRIRGLVCALGAALAAYLCIA